MKFNFKKISAVFAGALMAGMAMGGAVSAANYPSPFQDNVANTAVVYGSDALSSDESVANSIQADLAEFADESSESSSTGLGEESHLLEGVGNELTYGVAFTEITNQLDDRDLPNLLADGKLVDDDDEEDDVTYYQEITLSGDDVGFGSLKDRNDEYVVNTDAADDELPILHVDQSNGEAYKFTTDFVTSVNASEYDDGESINIAGQDLTFDPDMPSTDELVFFESKETVNVDMGESKTVNGDTIEVTGGDTSTVNLKINGNSYSMEEGDTEEGYYANNVMYSSIGDGSVSVELFAGTNEWVIESDGTLEVDGDEIDGVSVDLDYSDSLDETNWIQGIDQLDFVVTPSDMDANEKSYLEVGEELVDPLFGSFKMVFDSVEPELKADSKGMVTANAGSTLDLTFTSRNGNEYAISPMELNSGADGVIGEEDWYVNATYSNLGKYDVFLASKGSGSSEQTVAYQVDSVDYDDSDTDTVELSDLSTGETMTISQDKEIRDTGLYVNVLEGDVLQLLDDASTVGGAAPVSVNNEIVTEDGMGINLTKGAEINPGTTDEDTVVVNGITYTATDSGDADGDDQYDSSEAADTLAEELVADGFDATSDGTSNVTISGYQVYSLDAGDAAASNFTEVVFTEDRDESFNLDSGVALGTITAEITADSDDEELEIRPSYSAEFEDVSNSETDMTYALSQLGSYAESDDDEYASLEMWTPSEGQTTYNMYFSSTDGTSEDDDSSDETGAMLVTDSEMDDVDDMNLIVVGGSCVNTAAADLLGVEYQTCGEDFTEATGVGSGEALIKGYSDSDLTSEHAVLVAGYSADDTNNAAKYLMNEDVDTSEEYTVSSATEATMTSSE